MNISRGRVFFKETANTVSRMAPKLFITPFWIFPTDDTSNDAFIQFTFVARRLTFLSQLFCCCFVARVYNMSVFRHIDYLYMIYYDISVIYDSDSEYASRGFSYQFPA